MSTNLSEGKYKKQNQFGKMMYYVLNSLQGLDAKDENEEFISMISKAKQEMLDAQIYFDNVTAPELIDYAIYRIEAAKSHYIYLLKLAKSKGVRVNISRDLVQKL